MINYNLKTHNLNCVKKGCQMQNQLTNQPNVTVILQFVNCGCTLWTYMYTCMIVVSASIMVCLYFFGVCQCVCVCAWQTTEQQSSILLQHSFVQFMLIFMSYHMQQHPSSLQKTCCNLLHLLLPASVVFPGRSTSSGLLALKF